MPVKLTYLFLAFLIFISCSKQEAIYEPTTKINPYISYEEGLSAFKENDFFFASKKFSEAELNFDVPSAAAKAAIMASYSLYGINFYQEAEESLNRFLTTYPEIKTQFMLIIFLLLFIMSKLRMRKKI